MQIILKLLNVIFQIILMSIIPLLWWVLTARKKKVSFFQWAGLYKPELRAKWYYFLLFLIIYIMWDVFGSAIFSNLSSIATAGNVHVKKNDYLGRGFSAIIPGFDV